MKPTAIVTGAAMGLGLEFSKILARERYNLLMVDVQENELLDAGRRLQQQHPDLFIHPMVLDLSQETAAESIAQFVQQSNLEVEILINNAGFGCYGRFAHNPWAKENALMQVQVYTSTRLVKMLLPQMLERGRGRIMNVASVSAFFPGPFSSVYYASKAFVLSFSESLANELNGTGVTVTALCPGLTRTNIYQADRPLWFHNNLVSASAEEVAWYGYKAMKQGRVVAVPKLINKIMVNMPRFLPRQWVAQLVRKTKTHNVKLAP